jgi:hypothetical protein
MPENELQANLSPPQSNALPASDATAPPLIPESVQELRIGGIAPNLLRELSGIYSSFVSAFKELVSNAYDADATRVIIQLSSDLDIITVEDNGRGMTPLEFQNEYLRIGGSGQRRVKAVTPSGRKPIGRKGIGFLAVARHCRRVEILSQTDRVTTVSTSSQLGSEEQGIIHLLEGPLARVLAPFISVKSVQCSSQKLTSSDFVQKGPDIELSAKIWQRYRNQTVTVKYSVDARGMNLLATIDYDYLLGLEDDSNLEMLEDFCQVRLVTNTGPEQSPFTRVTLHLREFTIQELQSPPKRGWVRNISSGSGLDHFLWHLSRSIPVPYNLTQEKLRGLHLEALDVRLSPTDFEVEVRISGEMQKLRRPLLGHQNESVSQQSPLMRRPVEIRANGLAAQGYLFVFPEPIFPAELRGIAIRVRGTEIGAPNFLGIADELPVKYRQFLSQVMGEIIVTEGLDAISAITPGREGFYSENPQFQILRQHLVGDGGMELGLLGEMLERLREHYSVRSSASRIVQEATRRREAFLGVSEALTSMAVGSRYARFLRRLFSRSDIQANGLMCAPEYEHSLPVTIGSYSLEISDSVQGEYELDAENQVVRLSHNVEKWNRSLNILGRDFELSLRNGNLTDPVCEVDLATDAIYLNWMHPTRVKMGDSTFVRSALFWRFAYLAADGDVDLMMNLAHHLLSFSD